MSSTSPGFEPAAPPPPGVIPDFDHPRDFLYTINLINTYVCLAMIVIFAGIRGYVKWFTKRDRMLLEDYFFIAAWAICVFFAIGITRLAHYGEGYHVWELSQDTFRDFLLWLYICAVVYIPAAYATKVTLLLLIARVFAVKERVSRALRYFIIALAIAYLPIQIAKTAVCNPVSAYWNVTTKVGVTGQNPYCLNQTHLFIADISVAVATDFLILVVPIPLVMSMSALPTRRKMKIIGLLSAGGLATATTVYRAVKIVQFLGSTDPTADFTVLSIFTLLELAVGLICACLPSLNVLLSTLHQRSTGASPANVPRTPRSRPQFFHKSHSDISSANASFWWWSKNSRRTTVASTTTGTTGTTTTTTQQQQQQQRQQQQQVKTARTGLGQDVEMGVVELHETAGSDVPGMPILDFETELAALRRGENEGGRGPQGLDVGRDHG